MTLEDTGMLLMVGGALQSGASFPAGWSSCGLWAWAQALPGGPCLLTCSYACTEALEPPWGGVRPL